MFDDHLFSQVQHHYGSVQNWSKWEELNTVCDRVTQLQVPSHTAIVRAGFFFV